MRSHYFQESPLCASPSVTRSLSSPSSPAIHLSSEPLSGARGRCVRGILGLWRQFGNEARLHLNTLLSGHLVNLMSAGWGEVGRERQSQWSNCNAKRVCYWRARQRTLANINSLCKSAAQTNWQAGITPERSCIKSMKALAPLTLDLQPRPVHRSVPVMHTNDSGAVGRTVTLQEILFLRPMSRGM